ncbi:ATP-dependent nuclease [Bacillus marasmi]|uniref:ATP-dependent nuclease n=1 Tax=Bacillus marasmi TaxID=1926279 RepID=UPI0011CA2942|nr:AAA family ATPase [Bacillus marasmi]
MYLFQLNISNFRKYGIKPSVDGTVIPGLCLNLNPKLNLIVGENDGGKTAIIDAVKMVLSTQSNDFIKPEVEDFYLEPGKEEKFRCSEFRIECIFKGLSDAEAKNFLEWLSFEETAGETTFYLKLTFAAKREGKNIYYDIKAGSHEEGSQMDGKARELLRTTYLKPLRDSERELGSRRNSRLSQILYNHDAFSNEENHQLIKIIQDANNSISNYFKGLDGHGNEIADVEGKKLLEELNSYLNKFSREGNLLKTNFNIADTKLKSILEKLSLLLQNNKAGLGSQNLLFIATELLLLKRENFSGLKLALIEEIEAHLHPQSQSLLIEYLESVCNESSIQMILTTHSPNLASKVNVENLIICKSSGVFNMGSKYTKLRVGDYLFLQRFLDVTKSNLFFANGIIIVEGDAENILIPTLSQILGISLSKYGISVINVGSTAFLRYSNIFLRENDAENMGIPVACVTDLDVKPSISASTYKIGDRDNVTYEEAKNYHKQRKEELYTKDEIKCFVSDAWTLEYCIAAGEFQHEFFIAIKFAEYIENSEKYGLTEEKKAAGIEFVEGELSKWKQEQRTDEAIAYAIYNDYMLDKKISKAIVAQCFAEILSSLDPTETKERIKKDENFSYLVNAIKFAAKLGEEV